MLWRTGCKVYRERQSASGTQCNSYVVVLRLYKSGYETNLFSLVDSYPNGLRLVDLLRHVYLYRTDRRARYQRSKAGLRDMKRQRASGIQVYFAKKVREDSDTGE